MKFDRSGLLAELGPVQIKRDERESSDDGSRRTPSVYFPVEIPARTATRSDDTLRFGTWAGLDEARAVAESLAEFLGRDVRDLG